VCFSDGDDDEVVLDGHRHIMAHLLCFLVLLVLLRDRSHLMRSGASRNEKISNSSSFGIIDIADDSSTTDRIIVIVDTACLIHDGAYR